MSDVIERIKKRIEARKWKITDDAFIPELIGMQYANNMNDWCLEIIDEESAKEPQECNWTKGIHSVETCWGDIDVKTFNQFKRQGAKFCPYCGRKIRINE